MISTSHRFIFVNNPSAASSSVGAFFLPYLNYDLFVNKELRCSYSKAEMSESEKYIKKNTLTNGYIGSFPHQYDVKSKIGNRHASIREYTHLWSQLPEEFGDIDEYFKFAITRNPWDRALSFYLSPQGGVKKFDKSEFISCVNNKMPTLGSRVSKSGTLRGLSRNDVTYFVDFQDLKKGIDHVCDRTGVDKITHLSRLNVSPLKDEDWKSMYDKEMHDVVLHKHREEVEFFNYEF